MLDAVTSEVTTNVSTWNPDPQSPRPEEPTGSAQPPSHDQVEQAAHAPTSPQDEAAAFPQPGLTPSTPTPQETAPDAAAGAGQEESSAFHPLASDMPQEPNAPVTFDQPWLAPSAHSVQELGEPAWAAPVKQSSAPRRMSTVVIVAVVSGLLGGGLASQVFKPAATPLTPGTVLNNSGGDSSKRPSDSIAGIAARVLPTVVSVETVSADGAGNGSGQVIQSTTSFSYVLTNNHVIISVVESGGQISVQLQNGEKFPATVVGRDPSYDLAVLRVAKGGLPVISMGDSSKVVVGDSVIAIGSPLGLSGTVTSGIVSALRRPVTTNPSNVRDETSFISAIQTDAAINPGNSGGPLVDSSGRMVGVNSAIATLGAEFSGQAGNIGVGFSVPINQARRVAEQIINTGKSTYPVIGVQLDRRYTDAGARIAVVEAGGPAQQAGLQAGDLITRVDGQVMADTTAVITTIRSYMPGDRITITYLRDGAERTARLTLGSRQSL